VIKPDLSLAGSQIKLALTQTNNLLKIIKEKLNCFLIDYAQWGDYLQTLAIKPNSPVQMEIVST
jgi:hypothetical protein